MIPKKYRINKQTSIFKLKEKGEVFNGRFVRVIYLEGIKDKKFLFLVSKKVSKSAVERNRIKRIMKRTTLELVNKMRKDGHVAIIAKRNCLDESSDEIKKDIYGVFKDINLI